MPLYMDVHTIDGRVALEDVAQAHVADLHAQKQHDVRYLRYWVDEEQGKVFLPGRGPVRVAAMVHREAHGLVADDVFQVQEGT